jgi:hypothetical protein
MYAKVIYLIIMIYKSHSKLLLSLGLPHCITLDDLPENMVSDIENLLSNSPNISFFY